MDDRLPPFAGHVVALSPADIRATFLSKVYTLLLGGVLTFALTLWAAGNVAIVRDLMTSMWDAMRGARGGSLLYFAVWFGGFWLVHALARVPTINLIAYFAFTVLLGLLSAPLVLWVAHRDPGAVNLAAGMTAVIFTGLTAIVLRTGKDFSFLRGALSLAFWGLLAFALAGWLFGFHAPLLYSTLAALFFAGYILYDTSAILHRYPADMVVPAALELFTDVVLLFKQLLMLLARRD